MPEDTRKLQLKIKMETTNTQENNTSEKSNDSVFQEEGIIKGTVNSLGLLFNVTKQLFFETIGKAKITEDSEMKTKIADLQEVVAGYEELVKIGLKYCAQFEALATTSSELAQVITTIGVKDRNESMIRVGEAYRNIARLSLPYIASVRSFYDTIQHFREKVIGDTLDSKKQYDHARFLQDVFENKLQANNKLKDSSKPSEVQIYEKIKEEYESSVFMYNHLRKDLEIKLELLHMKRQDDMSHQMNIYLKNMQIFQDACDTSISKIVSMPITISSPQLPLSLTPTQSNSSESIPKDPETTTTTTTTTVTVTKEEETTLAPPKVETQGSEEFVTVPLNSSSTPTNVK